MNKEFISKIQNKILKLIPNQNDTPLSILLEDCCSELSRLVAGWIREQDASSRLLILKGNNVCGTSKSHDIIAVINSNQEVYIIDPTIWQFFPKKKSILVLISHNVDEVLDKIKKLYGGQWQISEEFTKLSSNEEAEYKNVISKNIEENLKNYSKPHS